MLQLSSAQKSSLQVHQLDKLTRQKTIKLWWKLQVENEDQKSNNKYKNEDQYKQNNEYWFKIVMNQKL